MKYSDTVKQPLCVRVVTLCPGGEERVDWFSTGNTCDEEEKQRGNGESVTAAGSGEYWLENDGWRKERVGLNPPCPHFVVVSVYLVISSFILRALYQCVLFVCPPAPQHLHLLLIVLMSLRSVFCLKCPCVI